MAIQSDEDQVMGYWRFTTLREGTPLHFVVAVTICIVEYAVKRLLLVVQGLEH